MANPKVTQLAGPWVLIKVKTAEKIMNAIKVTGGRGLSDLCLPRRWGNHRTGVRDKKGLVGYPGMATACSLQIAKNLSLYHMTAR